jgi:tricorn protease
MIYSLAERKARQVTDGMSDAGNPVFDRNGRYLYFTASTDVGPVMASSMGSFRVPTASAGYLIVLRKDLKSPLAPQSDEEKVKASGKPIAEECKEERDAAQEGVKDAKGDKGEVAGGGARPAEPVKPVSPGSTSASSPCRSPSGTTPG